MGIIFSANPVGAVIASVLLGKVLSGENRVNCMLGALIL